MVKVLGNSDGYIVPLSEVQKYLPKGYKAKQEEKDSQWFGSYRITRPNDTYFRALSFEDIDKLLHFGEQK